MVDKKQQPAPQTPRQTWIEEGTLPTPPSVHSDEQERETHRHLLWTERLLQPPLDPTTPKEWLSSLDQPSPTELEHGAQVVLQRLFGEAATNAVDWEKAKQQAQASKDIPQTTASIKATSTFERQLPSEKMPADAHGPSFWQRWIQWFQGPSLAWGGLALLVVLSATTLWRWGQLDYVGTKGKGPQQTHEKKIRLRFGVSQANEKLPSRRGKDRMAISSQSFLYFLLEKREEAGHLALLRMDAHGQLRRLYPRSKSTGFEAQGTRRWVLSHRGIALRYPVRWKQDAPNIPPSEGSNPTFDPKTPSSPIPSPRQRLAFFAVWSKVPIPSNQWKALLSHPLRWGTTSQIQTLIAQRLAIASTQVDGFQIYPKFTTHQNKRERHR